MKISEFISKDEEIKILNKQLSMIPKFYHEFYKEKIDSITKKRDRIKSKHIQLKKYIKKEKPRGFIDAKAMLWAKKYGAISICHAEIASKCLTSLSTVRRLSIEVNNEEFQINR